MELQVTITLSDKLFALLENKLPNLGLRVEKAVTKELGAQARQESSIAVVAVNTEETPAPEPVESDKPRRTRRAKADAPETVAPATAAEEVPETPQPEAEPTADVPAEATPEEARAALREVRRRLLGEGFEDQKGTPAYKSITTVGKQLIFQISGGRCDKIPTLTPEERAKFISECAGIVLGGDGLATITPPY